MLKRQRPATPPPSSLDDPPSFFSDGPIRSSQPVHTVDPSQHRSKRQRTQPPPLDGVLRGWPGSKSASLHLESDGEEDWIEDPYVASGSPPPATAASQYKDANSVLHELHVLNQHRLLFAHVSQDRPLNSIPRVPQPAAHTHVRDPAHTTSPGSDGTPRYLGSLELPRDEPIGRCHIKSVGKGLVEEVQWVRQRYEDANRFLGSAFLSRRREMEGVVSIIQPTSSR